MTEYREGAKNVIECMLVSMDSTKKKKEEITHAVTSSYNTYFAL